jgi:hypothetical protein
MVTLLAFTVHRAQLVASQLEKTEISKQKRVAREESTLTLALALTTHRTFSLARPYVLPMFTSSLWMQIYKRWSMPANSTSRLRPR